MKKTAIGNSQATTAAAFVTRIALAFGVLALIAVPTFALGTYTVDGDMSDWGVTLETASNYWRTYFVASSFTPSPLGTIDYTVEDRTPYYGESYDYEALYFDDTLDSIYVGVISSHNWNPSDNTILVTINGITKYAPDANAFAVSNLNEDERYRYNTYPNYFFEVSWSKSLFGEVEADAPVYVYANCWTPCDWDDRIHLCGTADNVIPEPTTLVLLGAGLIGLAVRRSRRCRV